MTISIEERLFYTILNNKLCASDKRCSVDGRGLTGPVSLNQ